MKTIGANLTQEEYNKVVKFIEVYNKRTGKDLSLSKFVYMCIKYFIKEFVKREKGGWNPIYKYPFGLFYI